MLDRQWHTSLEIWHKAHHLIPPDKAYRDSLSSLRGGKRTSHDHMIFLGEISIINDRIGSYRDILDREGQGATTRYRLKDQVPDDLFPWGPVESGPFVSPVDGLDLND